eukprot:TRINITY_DN114101_c0_g1_i1.p1 TRINITY_DN114101_c0_g1~~TRINITY_DN114101_c0_g1_i1.p1  ORF type:complete len:223 (+),score=18.24 TRINITY_DN114101_c0_g1_i1:47-715(+)
MAEGSVRVVLLSDTHAHHDKIDVPDGDIFIHAGDFTSFGRKPGLVSFNNWLGTLPHKHKFVVTGNHEEPLSMPGGPKPNWATLLPNATVLENCGTTAAGLNIHGVSWQGDDGTRSWVVPSGLDILISHIPPGGICDGGNGGCPKLHDVVRTAKPRIHAFGHVHEARGMVVGGTAEAKKEGDVVTGDDGTLFINGANVNHARVPTHPAVVLDVAPSAVHIMAA